MPRELALFLTAWQFLTRLPGPHLRDFQPEWTVRSARYFSLVGQIVGLIAAGAFVLAVHVLPAWTAAILAVAASALVTGAFHEDGLADTADGLGGGQVRERRLEIMKDSRIGTYGALALLMATLLKVGALAGLPVGAVPLALLTAHGMARAAAVMTMRWLPYAGEIDAAKGQIGAARVRLWEMTLAVALSLWPLVWASPAYGIAMAAGAFAALVMALTARRLIGGQTGDVLGAIEQVFETGFLLGLAAAIPILGAP